MSDEEVDFLLERFDKTEPAMQRKIVAKLVDDLAKARAAVEEMRERAAKVARDWELKSGYVHAGVSDAIQKLEVKP